MNITVQQHNKSTQQCAHTHSATHTWKARLPHFFFRERGFVAFPRCSVKDNILHKNVSTPMYAVHSLPSQGLKISLSISHNLSQIVSTHNTHTYDYLERTNSLLLRFLRRCFHLSQTAVDKRHVSELQPSTVDRTRPNSYHSGGKQPATMHPPKGRMTNRLLDIFDQFLRTFVTLYDVSWRFMTFACVNTNILQWPTQLQEEFCIKNRHV